MLGGEILKKRTQNAITHVKSVKVPTIKDFSPEAVQKAVLSESIQHPVTIYPAGIAFISLLYMLLISFEPTPFLVCFGTGLFSIGSFVFNLFFRSQILEIKYINSLQKLLKQKPQVKQFFD